MAKYDEKKTAGLGGKWLAAEELLVCDGWRLGEGLVSDGW